MNIFRKENLNLRKQIEELNKKCASLMEENIKFKTKLNETAHKTILTAIFHCTHYRLHTENFRQTAVHVSLSSVFSFPGSVFHSDS